MKIAWQLNNWNELLKVIHFHFHFLSLAIGLVWGVGGWEREKQGPGMGEGETVPAVKAKWIRNSISLWFEIKLQELYDLRAFVWKSFYLMYIFILHNNIYYID